MTGPEEITAMHNLMLWFVGVLATNSATDNHGTVNAWTKLPRAAVVGRRWDVPLGYAPGLNRFIILGGRSTYADYRKPRSYDVLTLRPCRPGCCAPTAPRGSSCAPAGASGSRR